LKKLRAEEDEAAKSRLMPLKGEGDLEKDYEAGKEIFSTEQVHEGGIQVAGIQPRLSQKLLQS
jgi:chromosome segregation ATPase